MSAFGVNPDVTQQLPAAKPRNRVRPLTAEWLAMRNELANVKAELAGVIARNHKWQVLVGVTAFLLGAVLGKVL